ncbi:hypothetical protein [Planomicrobium sp. CPCC 101079]|uniref:hypothetical protein n=1 Tax=Planomicrobium sp. CPCC 101079 TaxID=2599618 RepID=UPI0011B75546|nr:hypothetical protein [Planomicrobium sp. CPCC 101079]TWT03443.1 hypothetical protein FQV28_10485 [Planomicrobium sp. CPCC 101079]
MQELEELIIDYAGGLPERKVLDAKLFLSDQPQLLIEPVIQALGFIPNKKPSRFWDGRCLLYKLAASNK